MKPILKPAALAALMTAALSLPSPAALASGIPVVDAAAITQAVQTYAQLAKEYETIRAQYDEQVKTYRSISGTRSLGKFLWNPALRSVLPEDYRRILAAVQAGGASGLTAAARASYRETGLAERCARLSSSSQKAVCEKEGAAAAQARAFFDEAAETVAARSKTIESLMDAINGAEDAKAISDLSARIGAETAALTAEKIRVEALKAITEENRRLLAIEAEKAAAERWAVRADWKKHLE